MITLFTKKIFRKFRYIIEYIISFPISILLFIIFPFFKIKLVKLFSDRIGHYSLNTELMLCTLDQNPPLIREKYFFYTCSSLTPICNNQLHLMWKRTLPILPCPDIVFKIDKILKILLGPLYKKDRVKSLFEQTCGVNDIDGLLSKISQPHLVFTEEEKIKGEEWITTLGIPANARFICLLVRDADYLNQHLPNINWEYHAFRNANIQNYKQAALFLAEKGYYVIRMGKYVKNIFQINHPRIIDYANSSLRSDFMDIYLTSRCYFFISTVTGLDCVAQVFRRPVVFTNVVLPSELLPWYPNMLFIPKKIINKKNNIILNFHEIYDMIFPHWSKISMMEILKTQKLDVIENSPEDILSLIKEAEARLTNDWKETEEDRTLQQKFWKNFPCDLIQQGYPAYSKQIDIKLGSRYLKDYTYAMLDRMKTC